MLGTACALKVSVGRSSGCISLADQRMLPLNMQYKPEWLATRLPHAGACCAAATDSPAGCVMIT
jgi:hypothetical protein